ncbi:hypothetical protein BDV36DRAFT_264359 [Aspergillus pseudocaelatus]|uniref:Uncharacterized protein n=1 Tax=Aspergillus pseudocaelatus TaxID=1825620 RepID=A0ABQ6WC91_9EURO|nr:hypothetical protein BDV36DRAFT_264359 [Aspergillus pseudocaelatus]
MTRKVIIAASGGLSFLAFVCVSLQPFISCAVTIFKPPLPTATFVNRHTHGVLYSEQA